MSDEQKSKYLEMVRLGFGRGLACSEIKITLRDLRSALREDVDFKDRVETEEQAYRDALESIVSNDALSGSVGSALAMRALQLRVDAQQEARVMERKELKAREMEVAAKCKAVDHLTTGQSSGISFRNLDNGELEEYSRIYGVIKRGETIQTEDAVKFAQLTGKISQSPVGPVELGSTGSNGHRLSRIIDLDGDDE